MTCDEVTVSVDYMSFFNCEITPFSQFDTV